MSFILFARAHGVDIEPSKLFPSDRIRRCGTVEKPRSGNGAYFWDGQRGWDDVLEAVVITPVVRKLEDVAAHLERDDGGTAVVRVVDVNAVGDAYEVGSFGLITECH